MDSDPDESGAQALRRVLTALHPSVELEGSTATAIYRPEPEHRGNPGWLHGGFAATLLDHVCARSASAALGSRVVTGRLDLRYRKPVRLTEDWYRLVATAAEPRRSTVRVRGRLTDRDGTVLVDANALFVTLAVT